MMGRYILRRLWQTIPTILGVILINFLLFNVVGTSPALMILGNKANAKSLEEFDEVRGFNKPLLFGRQTETRAYETVDFAEGIGRWSAVSNAALDVENDALILTGETEPLAFSLRTDSVYEWTIEYQLEPGSDVLFFGQPLKSGDWVEERVRVTLSSPEEVQVVKGAVRFRVMELHRLTKNPFDSQLFFYLGQLCHGDLGYSSHLKQPVSRLLMQGLIPSLSLTVPIFFIGLVTAITLALICAFFRDTFIDRSLVIISVALMSINYLVYIVAGQYVLAYKWGAFPVWGYESWRYLVLPVVIGVISGLGGNLRFYRTIMLDEMHKEYIRTALAKGVSRSRVLFVHVLKNALVPIVTNVVIAIPFLYTGSLLLESFFGIPGLGYLSVNAINSSDVDVVRALVLIGALIFVVANLLTDICYALVDPRAKVK